MELKVNPNKTLSQNVVDILSSLKGKRRRMKQWEQGLLDLAQQEQKVRVKMIYGNDWKAIYIDDKLAYQGHSIPDFKVLEVLGVKYDTFEANEEWLEQNGSFPENWENCFESD